MKLLTAIVFISHVTLMGCMELVRRPKVPFVTQIETQRKEIPPQQKLIKQETASTKTDHSNLSAKKDSKIEEINSYALWCIENNMWREAQSHIKRGLEIDSLSASLHNNMAIIYEQVGRIDSATWHYKHALSINPDNKTYKSNFQRMKSREQAIADTSGNFDLFETELNKRSRKQYGYPTNQKLIIGE